MNGFSTRFAAALGVLAMLAGPAAAARLDLAGPYGNAAGCRYLATNVYGDDSVVMLTPDSFETFVTSCEFLQVLAASSGASVVTMLCGHEGDEAQTVEFLRVVKDPNGLDAYDIFAGTGDARGRVERCRP
jgi:hypothetical protein